MKTNKKVWLIVGIGVFAIVIAVLFSNYAQQTAERGQLEGKLSTAQALLSKLTVQKEDLEDQLAQAESLLGTSQAKFPESVESIEYGEDLFEIADNCDVALTSLRPSKPADKEAGGATYSVSSFVVIVKGDVSDILDFVDALRVGEDFQLPWSAELKAVKIDYSDEEDSATINLDIYAYEGE